MFSSYNVGGNVFAVNPSLGSDVLKLRGATPGLFKPTLLWRLSFESKKPKDDVL